MRPIQRLQSRATVGDGGDDCAPAGAEVAEAERPTMTAPASGRKSERIGCIVAPRRGEALRPVRKAHRQQVVETLAAASWLVMPQKGNHIAAAGLGRTAACSCFDGCAAQRSVPSMRQRRASARSARRSIHTRVRHTRKARPLVVVTDEASGSAPQAISFPLLTEGALSVAP
jgi:hypothetical protein